MTNTREDERQGPPRLLVILLAIYAIGLLLEVGAAFALARLPGDGRNSGGVSPSESTDVVTPAGLTRKGSCGPSACVTPIATRAHAHARLAP